MKVIKQFKLKEKLKRLIKIRVREGPSFGNFCLWERFPYSRKLSFGKVFESFYFYQKKVFESMFSLKCFENFVLVKFSREMIRKLYQNKVFEIFERNSSLENFLLVKKEWFENFTKWKFSWIWKSLSQAKITKWRTLPYWSNILWNIPW